MGLDSFSHAWGTSHDYPFPFGWQELTALPQIRSGGISSLPRVTVTEGPVHCQLNNQRKTNKFGTKEIEKPLPDACHRRDLHGIFRRQITCVDIKWPPVFRILGDRPKEVLKHLERVLISIQYTD
jgi:hypothetical protein